MKIRKEVSIDKFMKLMENLENQRYEKIIPALERDIIEDWREEILKRFTEMKINNSFGELTEQDIERYAANFTPPPRTKEYSYWLKKNEFGEVIGRVWSAYNRKYPFTYKKTGELEEKMYHSTQYKIKKTQPNQTSVLVRIPLKTRNLDPQTDPDVYMFLEEQRSFIKASFIMAWKSILTRIMEKIGK